MLSFTCTPEILILVESIVPAFAAVQSIMRLAVTDVPPTDKLVNAAAPAAVIEALSLPLLNLRELFFIVVDASISK